MPVGNYTFTDLDHAEINLIGAALGKLVYEQVAPLLAKLKRQAMEQEVQWEGGANPAPAPTEAEIAAVSAEEPSKPKRKYVRRAQTNGVAEPAEAPATTGL